MFNLARVVYFLFSLTLFSTQAIASTADDFQFIPSSVPDSSQPWMVDFGNIVDQDIKLRVKVFPHTLKNDGKHGKPDDKSELELKADAPFIFNMNGKQYKAKHVKIVAKSQGLYITYGRSIQTTDSLTLTTTDVNPVQLYRKVSPDKSHSYEGKIEIYRSGSGIVAINEITIEKYLKGVVPSESPSYWPLESLKAQAVAARSYSYYHYLTAPSSRIYHVDDTARFQVYAGLSGADDRTDIAIKETEGEILTYEDKVVVAFFHSYSGGTTDSAQNIFKTRSAPYCIGDLEIFSRYDLKKELNPRSHWIVNWTTDKFTAKHIITRLKSHSSTKKQFSRYSTSDGIDILEDTMNQKSGTVQTLFINQGKKSEVIDFTILRAILGWSNFPAYHYRVESLNNGESYQFNGYGWGHHVGMSQWGAFMMAKHHNSTYKDILSHYYDQTEIKKL